MTEKIIKSSYKKIDKIKQHKLFMALWNNKLSAVLGVLLIVVVLWSSLKIKSIKNEQQSIVDNNEFLIDSITNANVQLATKVFSWAIRSEMIRDNNENVNQFFMALIKEPNVEKIQMIDPKQGKIVLSTNKKEEGKVFTNETILKADDVFILRDSLYTKVVCPVMGFNSRFGVLVIDFDK